MLDRPLEKRGNQRAEGGQQVDLRRVQRKDLATLVTGQESETAPVADKRNDHERANPEPARDLLRDRPSAGRFLDVRRPAGRKRSLERAEVCDREGRRKSGQLGRCQAVPRERDDRRGLRDITDDPDPLEPEAACNSGARTLEHCTRPELSSRQRARQYVEGLELDMRLAGHVTRRRHGNSRRTPTLSRGHGSGKRAVNILR